MIEHLTAAMELEHTDRLNAHIKAVQHAGMHLGVPTAQLTEHDRSKWSLEEFKPYALYFGTNQGKNVSPVAQSTISTQFAQAWLHHIHYNPHHWQHWMFADGFSPKNRSLENGVLEMPQHYVLEMVADWMGDSYVYTGSWEMSDWLKVNLPKIRVHSQTRKYLETILISQGYSQLLNELKASAT